MPGYSIARDLQVFTFPAMDAISDELLVFSVSFDDVIFNQSMFAVLDEDSKVIVVQDIIFYRNIIPVVDPDAARVVKLRMA